VKRKVIGGILSVVIGLPLLAMLAVVLFLAALNPVVLGVSSQITGRFVVSGREREYLLHVPSSYDGSKPTSLVISMHGAALWPATQMETTRWNQVADRHGFIVVYPSGARLAPAPFLPALPAWRVTSEAGRNEDVRFISELIDRLEAAYNVDPSRIYADGLSNGGAMAYVLSCALPDRIAAVGVVAGAQVLPWSWCTGERPVPMIAFHGTADPLVPYGGGSSWAAHETFQSVPEWTARWAHRNRCDPNAVQSQAATGVTRLEYANCAEDTPVVLFTIQGGGHTWPGGKPMPRWMVGPTSDAIDATGEMWAFFDRHPLPRSH
jgi:polyhydroxybutyrate depolymerase